jgi:hypothetical protein
MTNEVSAALIRSMAQRLRRTGVSAARANELARDVQRLNDAALDAAAENDFNDEPAGFAATLARLKSPASQR